MDLPPTLRVQPVAALLSVSKPIATDAVAAFAVIAAIARTKPTIGAATALGKFHGNERLNMANSSKTTHV
jgi:hypothetical protein